MQTENLDIPNIKVGPKKIWFRQVLLVLPKIRCIRCDFFVSTNSGANVMAFFYINCNLTFVALIVSKLNQNFVH